MRMLPSMFTRTQMSHIYGIPPSKVDDYRRDGKFAYMDFLGEIRFPSMHTMEFIRQHQKERSFKMMTRRQLAKFLQVPASAVDDYRNANLISSFKFRGAVRFLSSHVANFLVGQMKGVK
jgi:hypothetical protein